LHSRAFNYFPIMREKKEDFFMRKALVILFAFLLVAPLVAQERTGRIIGMVVDQDGNPIPGVTVTLLATAGAPMQAITTAEGSFRFLALPPSTGYALKAELEGFKNGCRFFTCCRSEEDLDLDDDELRDPSIPAQCPRPVGHPADDAAGSGGQGERRWKRVGSAGKLCRPGW